MRILNMDFKIISSSRYFWSPVWSTRPYKTCAVSMSLAKPCSKPRKFDSFGASRDCIFAAEVSQKSKMALSCCMGSTKKNASRLAWEGHFWLLQLLCSENASFAIWSTYLARAPEWWTCASGCSHSACINNMCFWLQPQCIFWSPIKSSFIIISNLHDEENTNKSKSNNKNKQ